LLDVDLAVSEQVIARTAIVCHPRGVTTEGLDRRRHGDPVGVREGEVASLDLPGQRATAQVGGAVAKALLVSEGEHLYGKRQPPVGIVQALHRSDRDQHPKRPVVLPCVPHRVEVRTDQER